ncbi:hypothetical protein NL676_020611 [Syzygium grande]|nr:hypothetical protein NL676_020611 [Syzygium grande]
MCDAVPPPKSLNTLLAVSTLIAARLWTPGTLFVIITPIVDKLDHLVEAVGHKAQAPPDRDAKTGFGGGSVVTGHEQKQEGGRESGGGELGGRDEDDVRFEGGLKVNGVGGR